MPLPINQILCGHDLDILPTFPVNSIDTIITSPPYWGLRVYGGDEVKVKWSDGSHCQLGLEPTFELYIEHMLEITAGLKRVLKKTGSFYLNMGDTYGGSYCGTGDTRGERSQSISRVKLYSKKPSPQVKYIQKCLLGIPWRLALAMIDQGWILRNSIIWHKPNAMPSSVKDRLSNTYEFLFHFVKNRKYYYDLDAIREPQKYPEDVARRMMQDKLAEVNPFKKGTAECRHTKIQSEQAEMFGSPRARYHRNPDPRGNDKGGPGSFAVFKSEHPSYTNPAGKNPGDVWTIPTHPYPEAHFATFPEALCEKPIIASCPYAICKQCGLPRVRVVRTELVNVRPHKLHKGMARESVDTNDPHYMPAAFARTGVQGENKYTTTGWTDCGCNAGFEPGIVLDPFCGKGTACVVAKKLGRRWIGIDISRKYCDMAEREMAKTYHQQELWH